MKLSIPDRISRILGFILVFLGFLVLIFSVLEEIFIPDSNDSLVYLVIAYYTLVSAMAVIDTTVYGNKRGFKELSMPSFFMFCLLIPGAFGISIVLVIAKIIYIPLTIISLICWGTHIIMLGIWFIPKLIKIGSLKVSEIMKLDFYSSLILIPLTVIWVIYHIDSFKLGFAIIMFELMTIQAFTKIALIAREVLKEKQEESKRLKESDKIEEKT